MSIKKYADDYEMVVTIDENGQEKTTARYCGDYFEVSHKDSSFLQFRRSSLLLLAVIVVLHISGGFVGNPGMYQFYVALPYVISFYPLTIVVVSVLRLPKEKRKLRRDEIELSYGRIKSMSMVLFILCGIGVLGEIMFLFFVFEGQGMLDVLYLAFELLAIFPIYFLIRSQNQIQIRISGE